MDFPVCPVDGLPICPDEAASAAALMELIGGAGRWGDESANGSRGAVVGGCGHTSFGLFVCGAVCSDERSVASGGATMSGFSESEGDNADAIDQADGEAQNPGDQGAVIQDRTDSGDGGSAQSTGKVDAQATGWKRGYESGTIRVGNHPPDRAPCPERALERRISGYADKLGDHVVELAVGLTFDSLGEAYDYSWEAPMVLTADEGKAPMVLTADEGKAPMVLEDPIIEAVRRMIMGGGPMIRKGGQAASGQVAPHLPAKVRPKREFREKHPKKLRLHPDEPIDMMCLYLTIKRSGAPTWRNLGIVLWPKKWYCHTHPYTVQLTGNQIESSFNRYGDPEVDHMVSMWKLVRKEEAELFPGLPKRFKVIPDPRLGSELMEAERSSDLNYDYIATLINEEHTDVRIEAAKKILILREHMDSWAVYVVDMKKKICLVMDLVETEEPWHEVGAKHRRNAIRMLSNLCRCIHECIPGARISSAGWALDYNTAMHTCCGREESWINAMYYLREYTGEKLQGLTDMLFDRTRSTTWDAYQLVTMQENMAVLPWCMREPEEED